MTNRVEAPVSQPPSAAEHAGAGGAGTGHAGAGHAGAGHADAAPSDLAPLVLSGRGLSPAEVEAVAHGRAVTLDAAALQRVRDNQRALLQLLRGQAPIYGVTTGFGALVDKRVPVEQAASMQLALLRSHAAGVGAELPAEVVRAAIVVRLDGLLKGASGVRPLLVERLASLLNSGITPRVPRTGSLGASGDLAPSAHAFLVLVGEGQAYGPDGSLLSGAEALRACGLEPLRLEPKEGLALINGTHFMAGMGALHIRRATRLAYASDRVAAVTIDALHGASAAFDPRVVVLRPLPGQQASARVVRETLSGSQRTRPPGSGAAQDSYALRCVPQIHGAAREAIGFATRLIGYDLDAVTDNPVVLGEPAEVLSAGNFHGQSLALAFDTLRLALADLASLSERRTFRLLSPSLNGTLPAFLTPDPGHSSGLMIAQYTAAALVTEMRALARPVSIENTTTSDNQEDHVSMGMTAAVMTGEALERLAQVLAIELLCGCQALDLELVAAPGTEVQAIHRHVREVVAPLSEDRPPAPDIEALARLVGEPPIGAELS